MWHYNGYGTRFRMCDDAMLNVVAHQYIKEEDRANALVSDTFMKQFISIMDDVLIIPPHDYTDDTEDEDSDYKDELNDILGDNEEYMPSQRILSAKHMLHNCDVKADDEDDNDWDDDEDDDFEDKNVCCNMIYNDMCQIETKDEIRGDIERYLRHFQPDYKLVKKENSDNHTNDSTEKKVVRCHRCTKNVRR